jgi:hypothetical protein
MLNNFIELLCQYIEENKKHASQVKDITHF